MRNANIIFLFVIIGVAVYLVTSNQYSGASILSFSNAQFTSSSQWWNGNTWIINLVQGGLGQSVIGTSVTASQVGNSSGTAPQKDLNIQMTLTGQDCIYSINVDHGETPVYTYSYQDLGPWYLHCPANNNCWNTPMKPEGVFECYCVERSVQYTSIGKIGDPFYEQKTDVAVSTGTDIQTGHFDTQGQTAGFIGSNVYAIWNGYLPRDVCYTGNSLYDAAFNGGVWNVISDSAFRNYKAQVAAFNNFVALCNSTDFGGPCTVDGYNSQINAINAAEASAMSPVSFGDQPAFSVSGASVHVQPTNYIASSDWTLYVKAAWLGIFQPAPDINIDSSSCPDFSTSGVIHAVLHNYGTDNGNANVWANCSYPISSSSQTNFMSLAAGASGNMTLSISAVANTPQDKSCTIMVQNLPGTTHTSSVTCHINPLLLCSPGSYNCSNDVILQCNPYGSDWNRISDCKTTNQRCSFTADVPACVSGTNITNCNFLDIACYVNNIVKPITDWWNSMITNLGYVFIIIVALAVIYLVFLGKR